MNKEKNDKNDLENKKEMKEDTEEQNFSELNNEKEKDTVKNAEENEKERVTQLEKEISDLKDRFIRKVAEFENYKRRTENDQLNLFKYAAESFIIKLLPVIDDFERSLQHIDSAKNNESLKEGIKLVYDKFIRVLEDQGIHKIEAVGKPFDVNFHEALMQRKTDQAEPHTVIDEIQPGYLYKDKVIRHSKVVVNESSEESIEMNSDDSNNNSGNEEN